MSYVEELMPCPYDSSHRIPPHSMQRHLFKCRKNNPSTKLVACPFNTAHHVPERELKLHVESCDDRATFELYKYSILSGSSSTSSNSSYKDEEPELIYYNVDTPQEPGITLQNDDECWDDSAVPAYNPQQYCRTAKIIRKASLMAPVAKQQFYREEYHRHREIRMALEMKDTKAQSQRNDDHVSYDKPAFKEYRNPVSESTVKEPSKGAVQNPLDQHKDRPMEKKQNNHQQKRRFRVRDNRSKVLVNAIGEISGLLSMNLNVGC
ncbi:gametocyte-specific factor 1 homolog [Aedes albopictus]|uniref:CHHC U11-48K-type domain-containing protein n=1 Tax=Aedes albopictus TaxID=7160 RepID=A0ABM1Z8P2_AEDAL|nr:gametocyte-specific factor 1 homolog [Aedes albopictus]KXJ76371.1 hypothetical protein RP20_CCG009759 [Aedes albopictus]